eukprot:85749-Rhodomonas_salina.1
MGESVGSDDVYFLDSGCSYTIIKNSSGLEDIRDIPPHTIEGLTGSQVISKAGTLHLLVPDIAGNCHTIVVTDCLHDPLAMVNLVSIKQLNNAGYGAVFLPNASASGLITPLQAWTDNIQLYLPFVQQNNVFLLTPMESDWTRQTCPTPKFAFPAASKFTHHTLEELMHKRLIHSPAELMVKMNGKVKGLPRPMLHTRARATHVPCSECPEANATRRPFPPASTTSHTIDSELWQWDMMDMGSDHATIDCNRYATIFLVKHTLFLQSGCLRPRMKKDTTRGLHRFGPPSPPNITTHNQNTLLHNPTT